MMEYYLAVLRTIGRSLVVGLVAVSLVTLVTLLAWLVKSFALWGLAAFDWEAYRFGCAFLFSASSIVALVVQFGVWVTDL
jgi:hypothetical protein